jgi:hypothetical protein
MTNGARTLRGSGNDMAESNRGVGRGRGEHAPRWQHRAHACKQSNGLSWHVSNTPECGWHVSSKAVACTMPDAHGRWGGAGPLKISRTWKGGEETRTVGKAAPQPGHPEFPGTGRWQWSRDAQRSKGSMRHVQCQLHMGGGGGGAEPLSERK